MSVVPDGGESPPLGQPTIIGPHFVNGRMMGHYLLRALIDKHIDHDLWGLVLQIFDDRQEAEGIPNVAQLNEEYTLGIEFQQKANPPPLW